MPCAAAAGDAPSERHLEAEDETMNQRLKAALLLAGLIALTALGAGRASPVVAQFNQESQTFDRCTGAAQAVTVPAGVTHLIVDAQGAQGGHASETGRGGQGGRTTATLTVTPGQTLQVFVGCYAGGNGHHNSWGFGNGGGGGSAVTEADGTPLVVAGGGGGGGGQGYLAGYSGGHGGDGGNPPQNGQGGSGAGSGAGGLGGHQAGRNGSDGSSGDHANSGGGGGGGGGGYHGGDGGHGNDSYGNGGGGGGGGGSSYASPSATGVTFGTSNRTGNGLVVPTWMQAPTETGVSPDYGPASFGTPVTITGTGFVPDQRFQTESGEAFTDVQCNSTTVCTAKTPPVSVAVGKVRQYRVIAVGQSIPPDDSPRFTAYGTPTLTQISPTSGPATGGTVVWLTGGIYPNGATFPGPLPTVYFGDALATDVVCSRPDGTVCGVRTPPGSGTVQVTITTPGGISTSLRFTYTSGAPAPAASTPPTPTTRCTPWSGPLALVIPWQNCTG